MHIQPIDHIQPEHLAVIGKLSQARIAGSIHAHGAMIDFPFRQFGPIP
ncbi:hypothetical protein ABUK73_09635 [Agrobacterium sp. BA1120]